MNRRFLLQLLAGGGAAFLMPGIAAAQPGPTGAIVAPIALRGRRVTMACSFAGKGPYDLALDTGGVISLIERDFARSLGFIERGKANLGVAGRRDVYDIVEARDVAFGNTIRQAALQFATTDHVQFGAGIFGSLGAGILTALDSELDFGASEWRLYPQGLPSREGWTRHEHAIELASPIGGSSYLFATVHVGDVAMRCALDTGAPTALRLFAAGIGALGLRDWRANNWSPVGRRGRDPVPLVRLEKPLSIGEMSIERPLAVLDEQEKNSPFGSALVGLPLIAQLDLATQVKAAALWTRPNRRAQPLVGYNMSGLWIDRDGDRLSAGAVGRGSPADRAGLKPGDPISGQSFEALITALNGQAGSVVTFNTKAGGVDRPVTLVLEDYL
jgi:serine protease Do